MSLVGGDLKEEDSWRATLPFVKALTRRTIGQIWAHHTGHDTSKGYGTKTKEWQMDVVFMGMETTGAQQSAGLEFKLKFTKHRERNEKNWADFVPLLVRLSGNVWTCEMNIPVPQDISPKQRRFLDVLQEVCARGPCVTFQRHAAVTFESWRDECAKQGMLKSGAAELFRARKDLEAAGHIGWHGELAWLA
jgi:hypothetical protein